MRKIYYVPGLISAVLIPILFWYYGNQCAHLPYTVLDLGIPAKNKLNDSLDNTFESVRNWDYKKIIVKPNTALQNQSYYISELKKLQKRNEKETGIEFVIRDQNSYQDFITLMDAMKMAKQETFGVDVGKTGHFFAVHFYKDPKKTEYGSDYVEYPEYHKEYYFTAYQKFEYILKRLPKQVYYIFFGFLLFLNISMLSIQERFQLN